MQQMNLLQRTRLSPPRFHSSQFDRCWQDSKEQLCRSAPDVVKLFLILLFRQ
jgi:hypothetical protein